MRIFYFHVLIMIFASSAFLSCSYNEKEIIDNYFDIKQILKIRDQNNDFLKNNPDSPLPEKDKRYFKGLNYFKPVKEFIFFCEIEKYETPDTVIILTSKNKKRTMLKAAKINFTYNDSSYALIAYLSLRPGANSYFVPFTDLSAGKETYEAGRYLDITFESIHEERLVLDFNLAYNPYCAYNKKYSCPLVPVENYLNINIRAGEKNYKKK